MDWLLLVGLVVVGALLLVGMMGMLRTERREARLPSWLPVIGLVVAGLLFALSILAGSWLNAGLFALNLLAFSMLLGVSRRSTR